MKERKVSSTSGLLTSEEAANKLGVSKDRLYQYVKQGRLHADIFGNAYMFHVEDVEQFQRNPIGRTRRKPPAWREYKGGGKLLATEIDVQIRPGREQQLVEKLQTIRTTNQYTFPGSVSRYVLQEEGQAANLRILLIWKNNEMPTEAARKRHLAAFQDELADMLDWETAQFRNSSVIIHT
jgi:excisionase family DNA binding protein